MYSETDANSDVDVLLDRSDLSTTGYKTFNNGGRPGPKPVSIPAGPATGDPANIQPPQPAEDVARRDAGRRSDQPARHEKPVVMEAATQLLSRALIGGISGQTERSWEDLDLVPALAVVGATGGCGATTVLANAAALLASFGERVLLADRGPSLLPFYFGGRDFRSAPTSFVPRRGSSAGPVHLVTGSAGAASEDWLLQGLAELRGECDHVLVNSRPELSAEASGWACGAGAVLVLLTPDPASLLRLPSILERLRRAGGEQLRPVFLLNQLDSENSLHGEIRSTLSQGLGEYLLPFVIRRDDAFARSLAAGGTAVELEPESNAAEDIRTLVEWLRNQGATPEL